MKRVILTTTEIESLVEFAKEHTHGKYGIIVIETHGNNGIGEAVMVSCTEYNKEKEITDYNTW